MTEWSLSFTKEADNDFARLNKETQLRIRDKLEWLRTNFNKITPAPLGGEWKGFFKVRVSDWRIIYKVNWLNNLLTVYVIDRRDKVYKRV